MIELRGRLDDAEEEERKAKASKRITEWKLRKLNAKDGEGLSGPSEMEDKGTETEETMFNLPVDGKPREKHSVLRCNSEDTGWSLSAPEKPEKEEKNNINEVQINKQIRDLIRKRAEMRKSGRRGVEVTAGRDGDLKDNQFPPLPRRKPREKPRIISNIRIVPSDPSRELREIQVYAIEGATTKLKLVKVGRSSKGKGIGQMEVDIRKEKVHHIGWKTIGKEKRILVTRKRQTLGIDSTADLQSQLRY